MKFSIGIITAEQSLAMIRGVHDAMSALCDVTYLPYATMSQLTDIYTEHAHRFDGLVFSGLLPYEYVVSHVGAVLKPHVYFELTDRDFYKAFASLLFRHPGLDVTRLVMDRPHVDVDFAETFSGATPQYFTPIINDPSSLESAYEATMRQALSLWQTGKIDRVLTRLTNLRTALTRAEIPCDVLFPSGPSMLDSFNALYNHMQSRALDSSMTAVGLVLAPTASPPEQHLLHAALARFNASVSMPLVIRDYSGMFELITSNEVLRDLTRDYTHCLLTGHIRESGLAACVGWGLGRDIVQAQQNAEKALQESRRNPARHAYLVTMDGELTGPMVEGQGVSVTSEPGQAVEHVARELGISSANLQKLVDLQERRGIRHFSSADLAFYLNITPRSASRILLKLEENGSAKAVRTTQTTARGRPFKIYEVDYARIVATLKKNGRE
ncbi:hypothetical protein LJC23_03365 [Desulfovibrio sp. OttesenSCG-928-I05]|nr:hypothetical protein [Desulfovibrio sp. OttesenSCG-928-I05]